MRSEYLLLEETIKEKCKRGPVYYLHNIGNLGDSVIRYGAFKFFNDIGLKYFELKNFNLLRPWWWRVLLYPKGTLIFAGGGAWCNLYDREKELRKVSKYFKNIIVLPSSYERNFTVSNTIFFRRDEFESKINMPEALFCHDMAFYINSIETKQGEGIGYFFRTDPESLNQIKVPVNNNDISAKGNNFSPIYMFVDQIAKYEKIYTDRLHVSITASLMGKEVHLFPGSYFKNKAIYFSSMAGIFTNTYFHEKFDFQGVEINE